MQTTSRFGLGLMALLFVSPVASSVLAGDKAAEQNKAIVRRAVEEFINGGKAEVADQLYGAEYNYHGRGPEGKGPALAKAFVEMYRTAFPDMHITVEDMIAEGDRVAARGTATGTNTGSLMGAPPTGKPVHVTTMVVMRLEDGKIVEEWEVFDEIEMMRQLGMMPDESQMQH